MHYKDVMLYFSNILKTQPSVTSVKIYLPFFLSFFLSLSCRFCFFTPSIYFCLFLSLSSFDRHLACQSHFRCRKQISFQAKLIISFILYSIWYLKIQCIVKPCDNVHLNSELSFFYRVTCELSYCLCTLMNREEIVS